MDYLVAFAIVAGFVVVGIFEWWIGSPKAARMSWFNALLILSGIVAFLGPRSGFVAVIRAFAGLVALFVGGWLINGYYHKNLARSLEKPKPKDK